MKSKIPCRIPDCMSHYFTLEQIEVIGVDGEVNLQRVRQCANCYTQTDYQPEAQEEETV